MPADTVSETALRRTVYLPVVRDRVYDVLTLFDFANPSVGTARRTATVVASQALFFMNSPLVRDCARGLAEQLVASETADEACVREAYLRLYARPPRWVRWPGHCTSRRPPSGRARSRTLRQAGRLCASR